jgi:hypothetical protein
MHLPTRCRNWNGCPESISIHANEVLAKAIDKFRLFRSSGTVAGPYCFQCLRTVCSSSQIADLFEQSRRVDRPWFTLGVTVFALTPVYEVALLQGLHRPEVIRLLFQVLPVEMVKIYQCLHQGCRCTLNLREFVLDVLARLDLWLSGLKLYEECGHRACIAHKALSLIAGVHRALRATPEVITAPARQGCGFSGISLGAAKTVYDAFLVNISTSAPLRSVSR